MTSYSVSCGVHANDNDHFQLADFRLPELNIPQFVTGIRALLTGNLNMLRLFDVRQKAVITEKNGVSFQLLFDNGCSAELCARDLYDIEAFVLSYMFGRHKPNPCLTMQLEGTEDAQMSLNLWIEKNK